jgi:hypothetical protein
MDDAAIYLNKILKARSSLREELGDKPIRITKAIVRLIKRHQLPVGEILESRDGIFLLPPLFIEKTKLKLAEWEMGIPNFEYPEPSELATWCKGASRDPDKIWNITVAIA